MKNLVSFLHSLTMIAGVVVALAFYLGLASMLAASIIIPHAMFFTPHKIKNM